jgi:energy-coupling factor transporter transmembrane protein EcfT
MKTKIKWIAGIFLLLSSLGALILTPDAPLHFGAFVFYLIAGLFCLPPFILFFEKKIQKIIPSWAKYATVILSLILASFFITQNPVKNTKSENAQTQESGKTHEEWVAQAKEEAKQEVCDFKKMYINSQKTKTNVMLSEKSVEDCFAKKTKFIPYEMLEITNGKKDTDDYVQIVFIKDDSGVSHLDIVLGKKEPNRWRKKEGHDIILLENAEKVSLIFGDRKVAKTKGQIIFYK